MDKEKSTFDKLVNIATILIFGLIFLFFAIVIIGAMKNFVVENFLK